MANSMANSMLVLILLAAVASTTARAQLHAELLELAAAVEAATGQIHQEEPLVDVEAASSRSALPVPADENGYKTYVIQLETPGEGQDADDDAARAWHRSFLPSATTAQGKPRLLNSYRAVFTGFAALLTEEELKELSAKPGFFRSFEDVIYHRQTTHTPAFLGLPNRMGESPDNWPGHGGRGVVIGVVDDGIDDTHPSLGDAGMQDPPSWWLGSCHRDIKCNKKLIGAQSMYDGRPPRHDDSYGHGTHVATIAAGNFVANVSINGLASGVASGVAPYAHIAIYKVCGGPKGECKGRALVEAFDQAVKDGVDVISMSLAYTSNEKYEDSYVAIASFNAIKNGIHVVTAAGNGGPAASSVLNNEPWLLTVGASTVDRHFPVTVYLENPAATDSHDFAVGESLADRAKMPPSTFKPVLYRTDGSRAYCAYTLDEMKSLIPDHVLICDILPYAPGASHRLARTLLDLNPWAIILVEPEDVGHTLHLHDYGASSRVVIMSHDEGDKVKKFAGAYALVNFSVGTQQPWSPAPVVADLSARGPSKHSPGVVKPDLLAPGLNILAGVPRGESFGLMSGTSQATPHVAGLVALLTEVHPDWSPAIMRSALMTTATLRDNTGEGILDERQDPSQAATTFATGAGHVFFAGAIDPGLAYDIEAAEYIGYLCTKFGETAMQTVTRNSSGLCLDYPTIGEDYLNYPGIVASVPVSRGLPPAGIYVYRTLTNVNADGLPETYKSYVWLPSMVLVEMYTAELTFTSLGEKQEWSIQISRRHDVTYVQGAVFEGSVTFTSSRHVVRIPLVAVIP